MVLILCVYVPHLYALTTIVVMHSAMKMTEFISRLWIAFTELRGRTTKIHLNSVNNRRKLELQSLMDVAFVVLIK